MKKIIFSAIIFLVLFSLYTASALIFADYSNLYKNFVAASRISPGSIANVKYEIHKFPSPGLYVEEIKDEGKIELKNIELGVSLGSILMFSPKVAYLNIGEVRLHLAHDDVRMLNHDEFIAELISREALNVRANIKKLEFVEVDHDVPLVIDNFNFDGLGKNTEFTGTLPAIGELTGHFKYEDDNVVQFGVEINSTGFNAKIEEKYQGALLKNGKIELKSRNLASKIGRMIPDLSQFTSTLNSSEEVRITLDIEAVNNWIKLNNIKIESNSIAGEGRMEMSKDPKDTDQIEFKFSKIDLYSLKKAAADNSEEAIGFAGGNRFDFNKNKMSTTIIIDKIQLTENNILKDVELRAEIEENRFNIRKFVGNIDESGRFLVSGYATQNSFRSLFIGQVSISHSDLNDLAEYVGGSEIRTENPIPYVFSSQVKLSTVDVSLQNMVVNTNNNELNGNVSMKFIGNSPRINATLKLNNANIDENNFPALKKVYEYAIGLTENTKSDDYLNKFIPLRKINSMSNVNINISKMVLNEKLYNDFQFNMLLSPGRVRLSDLSVQLGEDYLDMNIDLVAQGIKPVATIKINDGRIGIDFLTPGSMLDLRKKIIDEIALDKFDLVLNFYLSEVYQGDFKLNRLVFLGNTTDKLLEIQNFDTDIFRGRMKSSGSILLDPFTFNFVYALNSASILDIAKLVPPGYINTGGAISASGMWTSNGSSTKELLYNLYTRSTVITKDITIDNFSFDDLIQKTSAPEYTIAQLQTDLKTSLLTGTTNIEDMKSDLELSKGIIKLPTIKFKTKYSSGSGSATINIYDFNLDLDSLFSFMIASNPVHGRSYIDYRPATIGLKATGSIFSPKKEAESKEIEQIISERKKK